MAVIRTIGFAQARGVSLLRPFRKKRAEHAVFVLDDETLGSLVMHGDHGLQRVMTLQDFERDFTLVGIIQPKVPLSPTLGAVLNERREKPRMSSCSELVCEVIRRSRYPGSFSLRDDITAEELFAFLQRPVPVPREAVRLFNASAAGTTPPRSTPPKE